MIKFESIHVYVFSTVQNKANLFDKTTCKYGLHTTLYVHRFTRYAFDMFVKF